MMRRRLALRNDTCVLVELEAWWLTAMHSLSEEEAPRRAFGRRAIARAGYDHVYLNIFRCMLREVDEVEAKQTLDEDWIADSDGNDVLSKERFMDALFQLADVWTDGITPAEYADFLRNLLDRISETWSPGPSDLEDDDSDDINEDVKRSLGARELLQFKGSNRITFNPEYAVDDDNGDADGLDGKPDSDGGDDGSGGKAGGGDDDDESDGDDDDDGKGKGKKAKGGKKKSKKKKKASPRRSGKGNASKKEEEFSALAIQSSVRGNNSRKTADERKDAAVAIGAAGKGKGARKTATKRRESVVKVQACARGALNRKHYWKVMQAVAKLQANARRRIANRQASDAAPPPPIESTPLPPAPRRKKKKSDAADPFRGASCSLSARQSRPPALAFAASPPASARGQPMLAPLKNQPTSSLMSMELEFMEPALRAPALVKKQLPPVARVPALPPPSLGVVDIELNIALRHVAARPRVPPSYRKLPQGAVDYTWYKAPAVDFGPAFAGACWA